MWTESDPLQRLPGETHRANAALHDYVAMGYDRSLAKLLGKYSEDPAKTPTKSIDTLFLWSSKHQWQARVAAWEALQRKREEQALLEDALEDRKNRIRTYRAMRAVLIPSIGFWQDEVKSSPNAINFKTLSHVLVQINRALRDEYGEPSVRADITSGGKSFGDSANEVTERLAEQRKEIMRDIDRLAATLSKGMGYDPTDEGVEPE